MSPMTCHTSQAQRNFPRFSRADAEEPGTSPSTTVSNHSRILRKLLSGRNHLSPTRSLHQRNPRTLIRWKSHLLRQHLAPLLASSRVQVRGSSLGKQRANRPKRFPKRPLQVKKLRSLTTNRSHQVLSRSRSQEMSWTMIQNLQGPASDCSPVLLPGISRIVPVHVQTCPMQHRLLPY